MRSTAHARKRLQNLRSEFRLELLDAFGRVQGGLGCPLGMVSQLCHLSLQSFGGFRICIKVVASASATCSWCVSDTRNVLRPQFSGDNAGSYLMSVVLHVQCVDNSGRSTDRAVTAEHWLIEATICRPVLVGDHTPGACKHRSHSWPLHCKLEHTS